ncbi:MAG TPA: STAS domain-containing protein [Streptosporangiaceae bacterium]|nr:STAS domain-containing protein [Streptosporangiaceae bacterium]
MSGNLRPARRAARRTVVILLPDEIDQASAPGLGARLAAVCGSGVTVVIADLTATGYCDSSGMRMLLQAHGEAAGHGVELRLVLPDGPVLRMAHLLGLDAILRVYPTLALAWPQPAGAADVPGRAVSGPSAGPGHG